MLIISLAVGFGISKGVFLVESTFLFTSGMVVVSQDKKGSSPIQSSDNEAVNVIQINPSEVYALIEFKNGKTEKREFYYGSSFLSQSSRFVSINENVSRITIFDSRGGKRAIQF